MIEERAILAALERIARMQDSIRSGMDICRDTGLVFLRVYYWYEYKLTVIDRFGNPDANYPALPGIKSKKQFKAGAVVAVALPYGDLTPAIIGEVEL